MTQTPYLRNVKTIHTRIASSGTVQIYSYSVSLFQIAFLVSNAGTTWSFHLADGGSPAAFAFGPWTAALPSDGKMIVQTYSNAEGGGGIPLPMSQSFSFISTGTPGVVDLWTSILQPSTG